MGKVPILRPSSAARVAHTDDSYTATLLLDQGAQLAHLGGEPLQVLWHRRGVWRRRRGEDLVSWSRGSGRRSTSPRSRSGRGGLCFGIGFARPLAGEVDLLAAGLLGSLLILATVRWSRIKEDSAIGIVQ